MPLDIQNKARIQNEINLPINITVLSTNGRYRVPIPQKRVSCRTTMLIFDASKGETHLPSGRYKKLSKRLSQRSEIRVIKRDLSAQSLESDDVLVFGSPQRPFSAEDVDFLRAFIDMGGSIAFFFGECGLIQNSLGPHFIDLLREEIGISVSDDSVVRLEHHKYLHPKHVHIANGIIHPGVVEEARYVGSEGNPRVINTTVDSEHATEQIGANAGLTFVYPNGVTLNVDSPSVPLLSSGPVSFPIKRPVVAVRDGSCKGKGRCLVVGSADIFANEWINKEENSSLCDVFFRFLLGRGRSQENVITFHLSRASHDIEELICVPDVRTLANQVKPCMEWKPLPNDPNQLFWDKQHHFDTRHVLDITKLYNDLDVERKPLSFVRPDFERSMWPLRPAVFQPSIPDLPPPPLELFHLNEWFSNKKVKLEGIFRQNGPKELRKYIEDAGAILQPGRCLSTKEVLAITVKRIATEQYNDSIFSL